MSHEAKTVSPGGAQEPTPVLQPPVAPKPQISGIYPRELKHAEEKLIERRREFWKEHGEPPRVITALALSGGGIRSATFCLGFMQALARRKLLRRCDFLSTVSGGGYAGAFVGAWMNRDAENAKTVEDTLPDCESKPVRFLRNNGRYLAPNGKEDAVTAAAAHLRSWLTVWLVLGVVLLGAFMLAESVKLGFRNGHWHRSVERIEDARKAAVKAAAAEEAAKAEQLKRAETAPEREKAARRLADDAAAAVAQPRADAASNADVVSAARAVTLASDIVGLAAKSGVETAAAKPALMERVHAHVIPSAFFDVALWMAVVFVLPVGIAYWFVGRWKNTWQLWILLVAIGSGLGWWLLAGGGAELSGLRRGASALAYVLLVALAWIALGFGADDPTVGRNRFTDWLSRVGLGVVSVMVFAVIDTIGQSLAAHLGWWVSTVALPALAAVAQWALPRVSEASKDKLPAWLGALVFPLVALFVGLLTLGALSMAAHVIAATIVGLKAPAAIVVASGVATAGILVWLGLQLRVITLVVLAALLVAVSLASLWMPDPQWSQNAAQALPVLVAAVVVLWAGGLLGKETSFVNASSHHRLYSSRLTRTFLGASNPWRTDFAATKQAAQQSGKHGMATERVADNAAPGDVTTALPEDQIAYRDYRPLAKKKGGPIHLINVTVNETVNGISNIEQRDRHGFSFALGPAGISVRTRDHAVFDDQAQAPEGTAVVSGGNATSFHTLAVKDASAVEVEMPPLGAWIGISGAAFTTGLGARTNLAFSFLLGYFNVRLGYWWDSGVRPHLRAGAAPSPFGVGVAYLMSRCFRAQASLFDEFLARFHGPARRHWYLSDGGHFENCAVYELIRRRVPLIVCCDCGADERYEFEDVANLVRKARIDFGAQVTFMSADTLRERLKNIRASLPEQTGLFDCVGRPEDLKPKDGLSSRHMAIAEVVYGDPRDPEARSLLVVVKPTLSADAPMDLRNYDATDSAFPQQSTLDQFFDEAQWESYRKLGEFIGEKVFGPASEAGGSAEWDALAALAKANAASCAKTREEAQTAGMVLAAVR